MNEKHDCPFVTCQFKGQIGNQLFIIAACLSHAWDTHATALFPGLNTETNRTSYNKDRLFFRLNDSPLPRPVQHVYQEKKWFKWDKIPIQPDLMLDGYFQSWKYFHHHRNKLLPIFAPSLFTTNLMVEKYKDLIDHPNTVAVHVRTTGRYLHEAKIHMFIGIEYYQKAMALFPNDAIFVIFSDRINWCKKAMQSFQRNIIYIEGNYGIDDLFLMSKMKHIIIGNSSFSWWGAYLNQNAQKKTIVPSFWFCNSNPTDTSDLFLPDWIVLPVTPLELYPKDMYDYGECQSCDAKAWDEIGNKNNH